VGPPALTLAPSGESVGGASAGWLRVSGLLVDFGAIKAAARAVARAWDERTLLPGRTDMGVVVTDDAAAPGNVLVTVACDGSRFSLPAADVAVVAGVANITSEALAAAAWDGVVAHCGGAAALLTAGVQWVAVTVRETAGQDAEWRRGLR
jgi:hypothetical protein